MIPEHQRDAYESTNKALIDLDAMIAIIRLCEDKISFEDNTEGEASAFYYALNQLEAKRKQIWDLREHEWKSLGGKTSADA